MTVKQTASTSEKDSSFILTSQFSYQLHDIDVKRCALIYVCVCLCVCYGSLPVTLCVPVILPAIRWWAGSFTAGHSTDGSCPVGSAVGTGLSAMSLRYLALALCHGINIQYFGSQFLESQLRFDPKNS